MAVAGAGTPSNAARVGARSSTDTFSSRWPRGTPGPENTRGTWVSVTVVRRAIAAPERAEDAGRVGRRREHFLPGVHRRDVRKFGPDVAHDARRVRRRRPARGKGGGPQVDTGAVTCEPRLAFR
ncbi:MAG: hypothetical protein RLZZ221_1229 [Verrucomicrobiota bacterium]